MSLINSTAIPSGASAYELEQSLRFNDDDSAYLSFTPSSAGNRKTWTYSVWFKIGVLLTSGNTYNRTLLSDDNAGELISLATTGSGTGEITIDLCGANQRGTMMLRDSSAWYHLVVAMDTANATASLRKRVWLNGESLASQYTTMPALNAEGDINNTVEHTIGKQGGQTRYFDGYMAEVHLVDGTALTPASFGETGTYGEWKPIEYSGSYGTNGFYLNFAGGGIISSATGGNSTATDGNFKAASFTANGTFTPSADGYVEYLVIAGGGAGSADGSTTNGNGGGGAGGYRTGMLAVTASTGYSITVGSGGAGTTSSSQVNGTNSVFSTITSTGGGGGGYYINTAGAPGGSGGGGGVNSGAGGAASPAGQGFAGQAGSSGQGGGGGGAAEAGGTDGTGQGGDGLASSITGSAVTRAGGGGGSRGSGGARAGGTGGGGAGGNGGAGTSGTANTGGGGGAGVSGGTSGSGGTGIVIIRYKFQ